MTIRRPMLAHWLDVDTRVGVATKAGSKRGRIRNVFKGDEHPYAVMTDDRYEIRCSLERLIPESEAEITPARPKVRKPKVAMADIKKQLQERIKAVATLNKNGAPVHPEIMRNLIADLDVFFNKDADVKNRTY